MNILKILTTIYLMLLFSTSFSQNSPFFLWGANLDGSTYQTTGIYSDTNYGLLFEAPKDANGNKLNISFNWRGGGTTPLFMQGSTAFVGIGTTDPKYPLTVKGIVNAEANGDYYGAWFGGESRTDKPSVNVGLWWNNKGSIYWNSNKMFFRTQINNTEISENNLVLDNGKVGIGTDSPATELHVNGGLTIQNNNNVNWGGAFGPGIPTITASMNDGIYLYPNGSTSGATMKINSSGYVGIGTTAPVYKLDVEGEGARIRNSAGAYTTFRLQGPHYTNGLEIDFFGNNNISSDLNWSYGGGPGSATIVNVNAKPLTFGTNNLGRMLIDASGNVGIGTFEPDEKLTVKGTIHTHEVRVDAAANVVPDYVFEKDYNLLPLSEVEAYVNQNKHLPEVPSAKEMEENGLNLKEMNLLLLKKVEELTLHLIEQTKRIDNLESENKVLKSEITK